MLEISVVIPCFNSVNTISKCIYSIFNQTVLPKEIIVIDDGSTDQTLSLLNSLKLKCPNKVNFIIISQKNSGPSVARNTGINSATSDWIAFLDSDDYWERNNIESALIFIEKFYGFNLIGGSDLTEEFKNVFFNMLLNKNYFKTSSTIVSRDWIIKYPFNERQKYSEDYRSWLLITSETKACLIPNYSSKPVIKRNYAFTGGGLSSKLWDMEKGELSNYRFLFRVNKIGLITLILVSSYSLLKYLRRSLITNK